MSLKRAVRTSARKKPDTKTTHKKNNNILFPAELQKQPFDFEIETV